MRSIHRSDVVRRTSDAEITRPQNEAPSEPPPLPAWHVHLELQPDELVTLHRLGFTGGALAWREGMREWQPLRVGDSAPASGADASDASLEDSLPQPIPLLRRSASRSGSGSIPPLERPRLLFSSGRHTTPPIANAMAVPRTDLVLPPPPPIDARGSAPDLAATRVLKLVQPLSSEPTSMSAVREPQQPPSIPPMALETKPRLAARGVTSRALWWGAAALVALSASNGALVSALLWSLRHDFNRPAAAGARLATVASAGAVSAPSGTACATASVAAGSAPTNGSVASLGSELRGPVSVDQLPLVTRGSTAGERAAGEHNVSADHSQTRAAPAASGSVTAHASTSRKGPGRVPVGEDAASARRVDAAIASAAATGPTPIDRRALAQAVGRATGAATSCADGPQRGRVALTFSPSGNVQGVTLEQSFGEPGINSCVLRAMGRARVRPFVGETVTVHKTVSW